MSLLNVNIKGYTSPNGEFLVNMFVFYILEF